MKLRHFTFSDILFFSKVVLLLLIISSLTSCGGVSFVKWIPNHSDHPKFETYTGKIRVLWKGHGMPEDLKDKHYYLLGKISGRSTWCGVTPPIRNEELQSHLIEQARVYGGNGIIFECGYGGMSAGSCYCYGDVIRIVDKKDFVKNPGKSN